MTIVHAIDEGLALLGGEDVGRIGQRLDEPLRRLVGQPHLGLADLLQGGAVDGGAAELGAEGLPVFLVLAISVLNPGYLSPLFHGGGRVVLVMAAALVVSGSYVIKRIIEIEV